MGEDVVRAEVVGRVLLEVVVNLLLFFIFIYGTRKTNHFLHFDQHRTHGEYRCTRLGFTKCILN